MEYSFSQTFGKGGNLLQSSPTPSFNSSRSGSRNKSIDNRNDHSPVIQSYTLRDRTNEASKNIPQYINRLSAEAKSYSHFSKAHQEVHRKAEQKIKAEMKNVDGLNQRMVNLINELRRDYSLNSKQTTPRQQNKTTIQKIQSMNNKKMRMGLQHSFSSNSIRMPIKMGKNEQKQNNQVYLEQYRRSQGNEIFQDKISISDKKLKYKNKIEDRFSSRNKKQTQNINSIKYNQELIGQNLLKSKGRLNQDSLEKYTAHQYQYQYQYQQKYQQKQKQNRVYYDGMHEKRYNYLDGIQANKNHVGNNYVDISGRKGGSFQESYIKGKKSEKQVKNHKSLAVWRQREKEGGKEKESWLKNKVKTIQSQMETNCNQNFELDHNNREVNQFSYVQQSQTIKQLPNEDQQTIYNGLNQSRQNNIQSCQHCQHCGLSKNPKTSKGELKQNYEQDKDKFSQLNQYNSLGFQNKLRKISQKIENYQKKVNSMNMVIGKTDSKKNAQIKYKDLIDKKMQMSMPFSKKQERKTTFFQEENKNEDEQNFTKCHQRKHTPTWGCEEYKAESIRQPKENNEQKIDQMDHIQTIKKRNNEQSTKSQPYTRNHLAQNQQKYKVKSILRMDDVPSLKERMNQKLATNSTSQKFMKQIYLDEQFRKCKKQLSKLPEDVPGFPQNKWSFIQYVFKATMMNKQQKDYKMNVREIFQLRDEEADPFFSIAVEDLKDYRQVVQQAIQSYINAQDHFQQNIVQKFNLQELLQIFPGDSPNWQAQQIRIDQFALYLSGATKNIHKCRDVYLLFRRIMKGSKSESEQSINKKGLIEMLLKNGWEQTVRRQVDKQNTTKNMYNKGIKECQKNVFCKQKVRVNHQ